MDATLHDFTKPTRLSVECHGRLTNWCRVALTLANKAWTKQLPAPIEASAQGLDVSYVRQELARLSDDTLAFRIKIGERLLSLLVMPRTLMLSLVNSLLGDSAAVLKDRELSLIEEKLADYFLINHWLTFFRESWPGPLTPGPTAPAGRGDKAAAVSLPWVLEGRENNPSCSRLFADADADVLVVFHWQMRGAWGETKGAWFFPKKALLDSLGNTPGPGQEAIPEIQMAARREAIVHRLPVSIEVVLGSAELRLSELSSLQVGDVVLLDQRATDGVLARVGGQDLFRGQAGRVGSWKALQIETQVKK